MFPYIYVIPAKAGLQFNHIIYQINLCIYNIFQLTKSEIFGSDYVSKTGKSQKFSTGGSVFSMAGIKENSTGLLISKHKGTANKLNCWEFRKCELGPGGSKVSEMGICPAATGSKLNGVNDGMFGGRACWAVQDTLCDGKIHHFLFLKIKTCLLCDFYKKVRMEEGKDFRGIELIIDKKWFC